MSRTREILKSLSKTLPRYKTSPLDWFRVGEDDLIDAAEAMESGDPVKTALLSYLAVRKYLTGFLTWFGWRFGEESDLLKLLDEALQFEPVLGKYRRDLEVLNRYSIDNEPDARELKVETVEAKTAYQQANDFITHLRRIQAKQMRAMRMPK